jgi:hypothetical protein
MTKQRLHDLLYDCSDMRPDDRLSEIADTLVTTTIVDEESTWSAPIEERILYGLACILNHASHNGLVAVWDYNGESVETLASAIEGLELIGEKVLFAHSSLFWNYIITPAIKAGVALPSRYSASKRGDYAQAEQIISESGIVLNLPENVRQSSYEFLSCWNTTFPTSVLNWIQTFEESLSARICED